LREGGHGSHAGCHHPPETHDGWEGDGGPGTGQEGHGKWDGGDVANFGLWSAKLRLVRISTKGRTVKGADGQTELRRRQLQVAVETCDTCITQTASSCVGSVDISQS